VKSHIPSGSAARAASAGGGRSRASSAPRSAPCSRPRSQALSANLHAASWHPLRSVRRRINAPKPQDELPAWRTSVRQAADLALRKSVSDRRPFSGVDASRGTMPRPRQTASPMHCRVRMRHASFGLPALWARPLQLVAISNRKARKSPGGRDEARKCVGVRPARSNCRRFQ